MTKELANWKSALAEAAEKTAKDERPSSSVISLKGGVMTYQDEAVPGNELDVVVVASAFKRTCFDRPYDPDDQDPPECFAIAIDRVDLTPHDNVPEPKSTACGEKVCEAAVFGTALQGKGPLCKTRRVLAIMPADGVGDPAEAELATITLPPTSVANFGNYSAKIANNHGLPVWGVKTKIIVKPHPKKQFEVSFDLVEPVADETALAGLHGRIAEAESLVLQPYTYEEETASKPKKSKKY